MTAMGGIPGNDSSMASAGLFVQELEELVKIEIGTSARKMNKCHFGLQCIDGALQ